MAIIQETKGTEQVEKPKAGKTKEEKPKVEKPKVEKNKAENQKVPRENKAEIKSSAGEMGSDSDSEITDKLATKAEEKTKKEHSDPVSEGNSVSQKENAPQRIITLRAVYGKTQGAIKLRPVAERGTGKLITGQIAMSEDEKRKAIITIDANTVQTVMDGHTYDLNDPIQKTHWDWVKVHPYIAKDFESAQSLPAAMFYVEDLEAEMDKKSTKRDRIYDAMTLVRGSSAVKRAEIMRLLGKKSEFFNPKQITDHLEDLAMNKPDEIINAYSDKNYKTRLLLYRLIDSKIVTTEKGVYAYGDISMGMSAEQTIMFLTESSNTQLVKLLVGTLNGSI